MDNLKIKFLTCLAFASSAVAFWPAQAAAETVLLECSWDGYPGRAPFTVVIDKDRNSVTINHAAETIGGIYKAAETDGPYPVMTTDQTYSWTTPPTQYYGTINNSIDRVSGRAMQSGTQAGVEFHTPSTCHAANRL
jgi:hypothetical protein